MSLNLMERVIFLSSAEFSAALPDPALRAIAEVAHEHEIPAGRTIFYEEDIGVEMYLIISGSVEVRKLGSSPDKSASGDRLGQLLTTLDSGDVVGEMSVLDDMPRSATVIAATDARVLSIHKEDLRDAIALCPDLAFGLFRVLSARLRRTSAAKAPVQPESMDGE